ncbi:MAG: hypothetical protein COA78_28360 [Blastopirellula sp.]|nr:MAG: hypothetical protein COA78_28360 [Blastopirellula sp.]
MNAVTHRFDPMNMTQLYLLRTTADGRRLVSWRAWVLIFLLPSLVLGMAAILAMESFNIVSRYQRTTGEVVRVYDWPGANPWDGETTDYSPVFRYEFKPGEVTEASTGQSSSNWNHAIGSRHEILFDPSQKKVVKQDNFEQLWALPVTIGAIGGVLLIPALIAAAYVRRWRKGSARSAASASTTQSQSGGAEGGSA